MSNQFDEMWKQQSEFIKLLQEKRDFPEMPVDLSTKIGQQFVKHITNDCVHELFEAIQYLKNSKAHRATNVDGFDKNGYVEELIDAQHFLIEIAIASGISQEEFYEAYMNKGQVNFNRINEGY